MTKKMFLKIVVAIFKNFVKIAVKLTCESVKIFEKIPLKKFDL